MKHQDNLTPVNTGLDPSNQPNNAREKNGPNPISAGPSSLNPVVDLPNKPETPKEIKIVQDPPVSLSRDRAEALLTSIIKYWIVELLDSGGADPEGTYEFVNEQEPSLRAAVGNERVLALCEELHRSEDSNQSQWYAARFYQFNKEYFDGVLPEYRVRLVYDVTFWLRKPQKELHRSHIDLAGRQIILGLTNDADPHRMDGLLLHHMAHAATGTTADNDNRWRQEMNRLRDLGAPVRKEDLG